jgi:hypothetical protein
VPNYSQEEIEYRRTRFSANCVVTVSLWLELDDTWLHALIHSDFLADYEFHLSEHSSYILQIFHAWNRGQWWVLIRFVYLWTSSKVSCSCQVGISHGEICVLFLLLTFFLYGIALDWKYECLEIHLESDFIIWCLVWNPVVRLILYRSGIAGNKLPTASVSSSPFLSCIIFLVQVLCVTWYCTARLGFAIVHCSELLQKWIWRLCCWLLDCFLFTNFATSIAPYPWFRLQSLLNSEG